MTQARLSHQRDTLYTLVHATPDGAAVLLTGNGHRLLFQESSARERVEVRCSRCGEWTASYVHAGDAWQCVAHASLGLPARQPLAATASARLA